MATPHHPHHCEPHSQSMRGTDGERDGRVVLPNRIEDLYGHFEHRWAHTDTNQAGARFEQELREGSKPIQLYTRAVAPCQEVAILLEELGLEYDAWTIELGKGDQYASGFVALSPNSRVPALVDKDAGKEGGETMRLFESGAILLHLASKTRRFIPPLGEDTARHHEALSWLFWASANLGHAVGSFAHFFKYCERERIQAVEYGVARFGMEVQRLLSVLESQLAFSSAPDGRGERRKFILGGDEPSVADFAALPWVLALQSDFGAFHFLGMGKFDHVCAWRDRLLARDAVQRGLVVGESREQRHRAFERSEEELDQQRELVAPRHGGGGKAEKPLWASKAHKPEPERDVEAPEDLVEVYQRRKHEKQQERLQQEGASGEEGASAEAGGQEKPAQQQQQQELQEPGSERRQPEDEPSIKQKAQLQERGEQERAGQEPAVV